MEEGEMYRKHATRKEEEGLAEGLGLMGRKMT